MYKTIKSVIESKDFKLENMLYKINKMYLQDKITEQEKGELDNMARSNAIAENSYDIERQLNKLEERVRIIENKIAEKEEVIVTTEKYPEFVQPTGAHDSYKIGDKVTFNGKNYICIMDNCVWSPDTYPQGWEEIFETTEVVEGV